MRSLALLLAAAALCAGCASRAANTLPEPRVALIDSRPAGADVELNCHGEVLRGATPIRLPVPPEDDACSLVVSKAGYRPARLRFDAHFVVSRGVPLRLDERHELDAPRVTSPLDVLTFPLQRWADRMQNSLQRTVIADYGVTVALSR
jgi:hypothetical protein